MQVKEEGAEVVGPSARTRSTSLLRVVVLHSPELGVELIARLPQPCVQGGGPLHLLQTRGLARLQQHPAHFAFSYSNCEKRGILRVGLEVLTCT